MNDKIFLLEDDVFLRDGLTEMLSKEKYNVASASAIREAKQCIMQDHYDLIILDVMLPDGDGFSFCSELRTLGINTPILFLTACDDEIQIVRGLDSGADDYVTKPFKLLELLSRVRALIRRSSNATIKSKNIVIDTTNITVKKNDEQIFVTKTEFQLLSYLLRNSGVIVTRAALLQSIWDDNGEFIDDNTLSVHISRLREKIGANHIVTIRGVGYRWEE